MYDDKSIYRVFTALFTKPRDLLPPLTGTTFRDRSPIHWLKGLFRSTEIISVDAVECLYHWLCE